jgi:hypothetical protein
VRRDPAPFVRQTALSDSYVEYQLNVHLDRAEDRISVLSALHEGIQDCFNEQGVQIMSPHYEGDPAIPKIAGRDAWSPASVDGGWRERTGEQPVDRIDLPLERAVERPRESSARVDQAPPASGRAVS